MTLKERIKNYSRKSKLSIAFDIIFVLFLVALLIPQSRMGIMKTVNKIRVAIWNPSLNNEKNATRLSDDDYHFIFSDLQGDKYDFSDAKGKVVFLNIWATWCPPCVAEMPAIQELYNKYNGNNQIVFIMLSNEDTQKVSNFIKKEGYTFPVYINHYTIPEIFQTNSIPTTFVISKSGEIVINQVGAANWSGQKMQEIMDKLVKE
jgi:thiol-disulfide isomerase/thioredoxin